MSFELNKNCKCLVATPVSHLPKVMDYIVANKNFFEINENANKSQLINSFEDDPKLKYIFINPNAQGYFLNEEILSKLKLRGINTCSTGTNHIDLNYCSQEKILVTSLKNNFELINKLPSTSELAFCLMQSLNRKILLCNSQVIDDYIWDYRNVMGNQLAGQTIGCLGYGRLGKIFCKQLEGFDVKIKVCDIDDKICIPEKYERVEINELFASCNSIAIHIHSNSQNLNLINESLLKKTSKDFILVNTSRGDICDENAIAKRIINGKMGGYGTDVLKTEFTNIKESPIFQAALDKKYNIIITPHVGGMTYEGQTKAFLYALKKFKIKI
tara:strand:+ start:653 stop:1636 length:984 start_codon:yes stop_codon:yes gene_type:complete